MPRDTTCKGCTAKQQTAPRRHNLIRFRALTRGDFGLLSRWLAEPHVARWWVHDPSLEAIEDDFGDVVDRLEPARDFIVIEDDQPVGLIEFCLFHDYPEYVEEMADVYPVDVGSGSIDYLIGESTLIGRGLGSRVITEFVNYLWATESTLTHLVVPVNSTNVASWRALLNAGFRLVAQGDMKPENPIDDPGHEILRIDRPATPDS